MLDMKTSVFFVTLRNCVHTKNDFFPIFFVAIYILAFCLSRILFFTFSYIFFIEQSGHTIFYIRIKIIHSFFHIIIILSTIQVKNLFEFIQNSFYFFALPTYSEFGQNKFLIQSFAWLTLYLAAGSKNVKLILKQKKM